MSAQREGMSLAAIHSTIAGADWARSLPAARVRRAGTAARIASALLCPVCGKRGKHSPQKPRGVIIAHGAAGSCWYPWEVIA